MPGKINRTMIVNKAGIGRRHFLKSSAATAAALLSGNFGMATPKRRLPNIILIVADNLGWRDLGCYGNPYIKSHNLDKLASEGVRFTNAFVTAPSCSPSRASIISGQSPHSVGVLGLSHLYPRFQMPPDVPTLPGILRDAGYRTAIDGKWHVAPYKLTSRYGYNRHLNHFNIKNTNRAGRFISENKDRPFYLELNFMQNHRPSMPGGNHAYRQHPDFPVAPDSIHVPIYWGIPDWPEIRADVAAYYSQTVWMDYLIGEILARLEAEGLKDNTMVVFVSDNGPMYPGGIGTCYDFGIGTPLVIRWPAGVRGGMVVDGLVSTIDILPTCMEAVGLSIPSTAQGRSLIPPARGEVSEIHEAIYAEMTYHVRYTPMRVIRTREYKYIENLSSDPVGLDMFKNFEWARRVAEMPGQRCCVPRPPEELYNIAQDPNEKNNLAENARYAKIKEKLRKKLLKWRKETGDSLPL